jgi:hypothetical protein
MKFIVFLMFSALVHCQQQQFEQFAKVMVENHILPHNLNKTCETQQFERTVGKMFIGGLLGIIFAPIIAPMFAAQGLYGAAALSNGLATIGGGSLAAGGAGMIGGKIIVGSIGLILGTTVSSRDCDKPEFVKDYVTDTAGNMIFEGLFHCKVSCRPHSGIFHYGGKKYEISSS